jgi:hypothetical protein
MCWRTVLLLLGSICLAAGSSVLGTSQAHAADRLCGLSGESKSNCDIARPPVEIQPGAVNARLEDAPWPATAQLYPRTRDAGLEVFTSSEFEWMAPDGIGLRYTGPLRPPLAEDLRNLLLKQRQVPGRVVLELDSNGGELGYVKELISVLQEVRHRMRLTTRVMEGGICASGCIPVFMQGETRKASGASVWVFHGARGAETNVPSRAATEDYLSMLSSSGLAPGFRAELEKDNRIYRPGSLILSGYELFNVHEAGIITELLPSWREETPVLPPAMPSSQ